MKLTKRSGEIAGGLDTVPDTVKHGGREIVVGENSKWYMRDKFLRFKYTADSDIVDEKTLLKIINLKLPLTFNGTLNYFDDGDKMPIKSDKHVKKDIYEKAMGVLDYRLNASIDTIINRLITEYDLRAPLLWVLSDIVKLLAVTNKKIKNNPRKIKISPDMSELIEKIWSNNSHFKYIVNSDGIPGNLMELIVYILDIIGKTRPPKGKWIEPHLGEVKYPCWCSISKEDISKKIEEEKNLLKNTIKNKKGIDSIKHYVFTILTIENLLINRLDSLEKYYIGVAKNMEKILIAIRKFFN